MMVIKDKPVMIGRRGNFVEISEELSKSNFTGIVEVSYRLGEISRARIVYISGKIVECKISKLISKTEINGDEAINELIGVDKCVVDVYTIIQSSMDALSMNGELKEFDGSGLHSNESETTASFTNEKRHEVVIETADFQTVQGDKEVLDIEGLEGIELKREELLKKYNIREPSEEEIEAIIKKAVEDELEEFGIPSLDELEKLKEELKEITRRHLGKLSKKIEESIDQAALPDELLNLIPEIRKTRSLLIFVPKENLNKLIEEMEALLKLRNVERINT